MFQNLPIMLFGISLIFAYYACFYAFEIWIMLTFYTFNCVILQKIIMIGMK